MNKIDEKAGGLEAAKLSEERGMPSVNGRKRSSKLTTIAGVVALVGIAGAMAWMNMGSKPAAKADSVEPTAQVRRGLPELKLADPPPPPPAATPALTQQPPTPAAAPMGAPPTPATAPGPRQPTEAELLLARRQRAPVLAYKGGSSGPSETGSAGGAVGAAGAGEGEGGSDTLGAALRPTSTPSARAGRLPDRNYLLTKGTMLDCALITALDSTVPGFTSCRLTRNVYSDNGRVLLLERGSIVEGQYQSGQMRQGMKRIFVLWSRVRTPTGVYVELQSPGADELGRSGLPGWVDTHFWQRFGGALLLSLVEDSVDYAVAKQQARSGGDSISFSGAGDATQDAASIALQNSINIPPTLHKNQGDLINIYVARDLDFRDVYELRSRR